MNKQMNVDHCGEGNGDGTSMSNQRHDTPHSSQVRCLQTAEVRIQEKSEVTGKEIARKRCLEEGMKVCCVFVARRWMHRKRNISSVLCIIIFYLKWYLNRRIWTCERSFMEKHNAENSYGVNGRGYHNRQCTFLIVVNVAVCFNCYQY